MSSSTSPPEPAAAQAAGASRLRIALVVAYPLLAHAAATGAGWIATLASLDIALLALVPALAARRAWAWSLLAVVVAALCWLARTPHALLPLLLAPPAFVAMAAWAFARTLRDGRMPLVGRIAAAIDGVAWEHLPAEIRTYTRNVTRAWAALLAVLAGADLVLALLATPGGLLARLGLAGPWAVSQAQWSWFANIGDYLVIGGFMACEFAYRRRRFPDRGGSFGGFLRRMAALGPGFWREALR
jgi:uncharacterized membrane protein